MPDNETESAFVKLALYCLGVLAGVGAKLAIMHRKKAITMTDVIVNSAVAFAAAFLTYSALSYSGYQEAAIVSSVVCGRFADDVLTFSWRAIKRMVQTTLNDKDNESNN